MDLNFARLFLEPFVCPFTDCLHSLEKIYYLKLDFIKIQKRGNITDKLLKTMDDFAFQVILVTQPINWSYYQKTSLLELIAGTQNMR